MIENTGIVAHLTGTLTPALMNEIQMPSMFSLIIGLIITTVLLILIINFVIWFGKVIFPKSLEYRKLLTDMYVVGMIKKFAEDDKIDLIKELKDFAKIEKKKNLSTKDIDSVIEANLKEKIEAKSSKEIENIEKD